MFFRKLVVLGQVTGDRPCPRVSRSADNFDEKVFHNELAIPRCFAAAAAAAAAAEILEFRLSHAELALTNDAGRVAESGDSHHQRSRPLTFVR